MTESAASEKRHPAFLITDPEGHEIGALWVQTAKETGAPTGRYTGKICGLDVLASPPKSTGNVRFGLSHRRGDEWLNVGVIFTDHKGKFGATRETQADVRLVVNFPKKTVG